MNNNRKLNTIKNIIIIAGSFTLLVSLLLIFNYIQISRTEPLESKALELLVERLSVEPNNQELIYEIRQLDLLTRKAYFNSLWQIRTGSYLLLFGAIVLVIVLRSYLGMQFSIGKPSEKKTSPLFIRLMTQRWVAIGGAILILGALISSHFSVNYLQQYDSKLAITARDEDDSGIEVLDIRATDTSAEETATADVEEIPEEEEATPEIEAAAEEMVPPQENQKETRPDVVLTESLVDQYHNSFRGPFGQGVSEHGNIPVDWDGKSGRNILWKTEMPLHGYNSPVIWEDKLFMSGANDARRVVFCLDRHTGQILWEQEVVNIPGSPATPPRTTEDTGLAAPTLTVNGNRVFAIFGTGDVIAFDLDGNRAWARNLGVPDNHYGHSSSLLIWNNKLFVQYDTHSGSKVLALNEATGETVWETIRTSDVSWASPILAKVEGEYQLILLGNPDLSGYDIETGQQLWSVDCMSGEVGPSPAYGDGLVYAANEYATMVAVNPVTGELVWEDRYYLPEVSSPVFHEGLLYITTTFAVIACFDAASGEFVGEMDTNDGFYSSPVVADDKIYVFDLKGKAYILESGRELNLISSPELGEPVFATPVFADGKIYIRGNKHLYCIGQ